MDKFLPVRYIKIMILKAYANDVLLIDFLSNKTETLTVVPNTTVHSTRHYNAEIMLNIDEYDVVDREYSGKFSIRKKKSVL